MPRGSSKCFFQRHCSEPIAISEEFKKRYFVFSNLLVLPVRHCFLDESGAQPELAGDDASGTSTPFQHQRKGAGRTWSSLSRGSGSIFSGGGGRPGDGKYIGTYNADGRTMRTVLRQKG